LSSDDCKRLRKAFENVLGKIGPTFKQVIFEDLEKVGISLQQPCPSLDEIEKALRKNFGHDGALLLIQAIKKQMEA
jgi:hypothetical protein